MKYLSNKVADDTTVIDAHARAVRVEDPGNPHLHTQTSRDMLLDPSLILNPVLHQILASLTFGEDPFFSRLRFLR